MTKSWSGWAAWLTEDGDNAESTQRLGRVRQVYPEMADGLVVADVEVEGIGDFFVGDRETIVVPPDYIYRRDGLTYVRLDDCREVVVQPGAETDAGIEVLSGLRPGYVLGEP